MPECWKTIVDMWGFSDMGVLYKQKIRTTIGVVNKVSLGFHENVALALGSVRKVKFGEIIKFIGSVW